MRETLHQLTLALALPIAVGAVWIVRGEPAASSVRETATAYRAELADLPLPTQERLRTPDVATDWRDPRVTPEDATSRRRRPMLPDLSLSAPPPVDLAVDAESESDVAAPPSPRVAHELLGAVSRAPLFAVRASPAPIAVAPLLASRRGTTTASTVPATAPAVPAPTTAGKPIAKEPADAAVQSTSKPARLAALEAVADFSRRDLGPIRSRGPASVPNRAKGFEIVAGPVVGIDQGRRERFENADGRAPLRQPSPLEDPARDLSLDPEPQGPSIPLLDVPLPMPEIAKAPSSVDLERELSAPVRDFHWPTDLQPTFLVLIPEPGSAILLGVALAALGAARRIRCRA